MGGQSYNVQRLMEIGRAVLWNVNGLLGMFEDLRPFAPPLFLLDGEVVGLFEEFDRLGDIGWLAEAEGDPAAFWEDVMPVCFSGRDELLADSDRKWDVYLPIAMNVADLTAADAVFCAAKTVWGGLYAIPTGDNGGDFLLCALNAHFVLPKQ